MYQSLIIRTLGVDTVVAWGTASVAAVATDNVNSYNIFDVDW
jgi:hypothetical protein